MSNNLKWNLKGKKVHVVGFGNGVVISEMYDAGGAGLKYLVEFSDKRQEWIPPMEVQELVDQS